MAGLVGGGGLGKLAYNYGFQRFDLPVMIVTIVLIVVLVQVIQLVGERISRSLDHR
jgi:D-methionine transport system permease protein